MTGWQFGWRAAILVLVVCSLTFTIARWVFTLFDSQYEANSVPSRMIVGVFAGLFTAVIYSPITLAAATGGFGAGMRHAQRTHEVST